MENGLISLSDYSLQDFGNFSEEQLAELQKAMTAGHITGRDTEGIFNQPGATLKVESLENTLKLLNFKESDVVLWRKIPKLPAFNTVEEYNLLVDYGDSDYSSIAEGEAPEETDSTIIRKSQLVKYFGTVRTITHQMQLVRTISEVSNIMQQQIEHGTMTILRAVDRAIAFHDSEIIPEEMDGLYKQHQAFFPTLEDWYNSEVVIDAKGQRLTEGMIEDAALAIIENHGEGSLLMAPPKVLSNFVKNFHEFKLIQPNTPAQSDGVGGQVINKFISQFGPIELGYDKFLKSGNPKMLSATATNPKAPVAPIAGTTPLSVVTDPLSKFGGTPSFTGDYFYAVSAINKYGESPLTLLNPNPTTLLYVANGESVNLSFTPGVGGVKPASGFIIYRSEKNPAGDANQIKFYPIFRVSVNNLNNGYDGGAPGVIRDRNRFIPNTDSAFLIEPTEQVWSLKQLAPLMKMDLGRLGPAERFMILMYCTVILYAPKKMVRIINIGTDI